MNAATPTTAVLLIDVQESFRHRPFWDERELPAFLERSQALIEGAQRLGLPVVRVLHSAGEDQPGHPFAPSSGLLRPLQGLVDFEAAHTVTKRRHSALVGTGLGDWLRERGLTRLIIAGIRTEQCCETTARHASDEGWTVDFVSEAMLSFAMQHASGERLSPADLRLRTETVLEGRFATVCTVEQALARAVA